MKRNFLMMSIIAASFSTPAQATNLLEVYQAAQQHDPEFLAAIAEHRAGQKNTQIALGKMLPQVSATLQRTKVGGARDIPMRTLAGKVVNNSEPLDYTSKHYAINVRQTVFDWYKISDFRQARVKTRQSDERFEAQKNRLALRVVQQYLEAILAQQSVELLTARVTAYEEHAKRAQRLYQAGEGTLTDIHEAQARRDIAIAEKLEALDQLRVALRTMQNLTGTPITALTRLSNHFPLSPPSPNTVDAWLERALTNNPEYLMAQSDLEISDRELDKARAGHLPTIELTGTLAKSDSETLTSLGQTNYTKSAGIAVNIPIFNGWHTMGVVSQYAEMRTQKKHTLESVRQKLETQISTAFHGSINGIKKINGHQLAVQSSEMALKSTRMGFSAGLRTNADILDSQEQLYHAQRNLTEARYQYLVHTLSLRALAGVLLEDDIARINEFLEKTPIPVNMEM